LAISLFGPAIRNLREFKTDFRFERRFSWVSFRLSALLRNGSRYFAAGVASVGFGPCYAEYLASPGRLEAHRIELRQLAEKHQADAIKNHPGCHLRHAEAVAEWTAGWELFLRFALEQKAVTKRKTELSLTRVRDQLFLTLPMQAEIQDEADPGEIYITMIRALLGSKRAVLAGMDGLPPSDELAPACSWTQGDRLDRGSQGYGQVVPHWERAGADRIGWIDGDMVYLEPSAAYAAVERIAREQSEVVGSKRQVHTRLMETGRIKTDPQVPGKRRRFTKRATVEEHGGAQRKNVVRHCAPSCAPPGFAETRPEKLPGTVLCANFGAED
jgi:hypothetical protein